MAGEQHGRGTAWALHGHGMLCVNRPLCVLSGFRRDAGKICALLGHNAEGFLDFLTLEDGTDRFFRNVCKEFPLYAA